MSFPIAALQKDDGHGAKLKPRKLLGEMAPREVDMSLRQMFRAVFMARKKTAKTRAGKPSREYLQRCAVQVRYTKGGSIGKWYSHGAYIAREAATKENNKGLGFDQNSRMVPVAETMADWRRDGDELFFRVILSPEFGARLDLIRHTRDVLAQMEGDLGTKLEWVAVAHFNTDNPHVHAVVRGKRDDGTELRIPPDYIKDGLRQRAEWAATNQLGYRTHDDIIAAQRREVGQARYTGLDRKIQSRLERDGDGLHKITLQRRSTLPDDIGQATEFHVECRLRVLAQMNLATKVHDSLWIVHEEFERSLRTAQKTRDRIKTMEAHGQMASDPNLPFKLLRPNEIEEVEGKVLVHAQDEYSGNNFSLVESVNGELVRLPQVREIGMARKHGLLEPGSYIQLRRVPGEKRAFQLSCLGDAELLLVDKDFLRENASRLQDVVPSGMSGWLGRLYQSVHAPAKTQTRAKTRR